MLYYYYGRYECFNISNPYVSHDIRVNPLIVCPILLSQPRTFKKIIQAVVLLRLKTRFCSDLSLHTANLN